MYLHLVRSPEFCAAASGRKSTCNPFRQETELMALIDHEFVGNSTSRPYAFLSCIFHMGTSVPLGKRLIGVFSDTHGFEKP